MLYKYENCFKTTNKKHWIFVPTKECRAKGYNFIKLIERKWKPAKHYYHFRRGGHVAAVNSHLENKFFAKTDLKSFFPSITKSMVIKGLKNIGIDYQQSEHIATCSIVKSKEEPHNYILPYGFVQSQIIATVCLDKSAIGKFLKEKIPACVNVSVYVDDILFSSNDKNILHDTYNSFLDIINKTKFDVNSEKSHSPLEITTSFNIEIKNNYKKITETRFLDFAKDMKHPNMNRVDAIIRYVENICPNQADILNEILKKILKISVE